MVLPAPKGLSNGGLADEVRRARREGSRWDAREAALIAEAEERQVARQEGYVSTTAWLAAVSGEPVPVCRSQVAVATALEAMPETRQAFAAGELSECRVRLLAQAQQLAPEQFAQDEAALVEAVAGASSQRAPQVLAEWKRTTDPEGAEREAERLHSLRALHLSPNWTQMLHLSGDLDPESGLIVLTAIRALAEPAALDREDTRTLAQRQADALVDLCRHYLDGGGDGSTSHPHLTVTVPWDTLEQGHGVIDTETGPLSVETVRRLACDSTVRRVILDEDLTPLDVGRNHRTVPQALREALDLRDKGCTHPGCQAPARWCDAHHIVHWADGGKTALANLRLLCRKHHRDAHHHQPYPRRQ